MPLLLEVLKNNKHHEYPQNIFSTAKFFKKGNDGSIASTGIIEEELLSCLLCSENTDYTKSRQVLDNLFRMIDVRYHIEPLDHGSFIPGRCGKVIAGKKEIGLIGEISPSVLFNWELEIPVSGFELNLSKLYEVKK
jgi:phenylalanyl-tRNA synthetase beta chain